MKLAIFPGTFDPITNGHINIIKRASNIFDEVIVLVAINPEKKSRFSLEERVASIKEAIKDLNNVVVDSTTGLTVEYAKKHNAKFLIRGLRNESDFEFETDLMLANKTLEPDIETIFLIADEKLKDISSSKAKELYSEGVDISNMVPKNIIKIMK